MFGLLNNVAWTSTGPCAVENFEAAWRDFGAGAPFQVNSIDKFPRMTDYVVPGGVRIADADRVRLGAHLADGTTVMHEGFVNFNAGTLGNSMVEGRISAGRHRRRRGPTSAAGRRSWAPCPAAARRSSASASAACSAPTPASASPWATTASSRPASTSPPAPGSPSPTAPSIKAGELSGRSGLLFRRNSTSGAVEALERGGTNVELNADLHSND